MSGEDAALDACVVEDVLDGVGHEIHGVDVGVGVAVAVSWEVDSNNPHVAHVGEHEGAPYIEVLEESMEEDECAGVFAAFVAIVEFTSFEQQGFVLFHDIFFLNTNLANNMSINQRICLLGHL